MSKDDVSKSEKKEVIKEENTEMKELGTNEQDLLIKVEDSEMKDIPFRVPLSEEVPDAVLDGMQGVDVKSVDGSA